MNLLQRLKGNVLTRTMLSYGSANVGARLVTFFFFCRYTFRLSPENLGTLELYNVFVSYVLMIFIFDTDSAFSYFYFSEKSKAGQGESVMRACLDLRLLWGAVIGPVIAVLCMLGAIYRHYSLIWTVAVVSAYVQSLSSFLLDYLRMQYRSFEYFLWQLIASVLTGVLVLFLIYHWRNDALGVALATLMVQAGIALAIFARWKIWPFRRRGDFAWWKKIVVFSLPLVPANLFSLLAVNADRWCLGIWNPKLLGFYSVAAKFSLFVAAPVQAFRLAWAPVGLDGMSNPAWPAMVRRSARHYLGLSALALVGLNLIAPLLFRHLVAPEFFEAHRFVGMISIAPVLLGMLASISLMGLWKTERTRIYAYMIMVTAALTFLAAPFLIERFGIQGAVYVSVGSAFFSNLAVIVASEKAFYIGYEYLTLLVLLILGLVPSALAFFSVDVNFSLLQRGALAAAAGGVILWITFRQELRSSGNQ